MRLDGDEIAFLARFATTPDAVRLVEILRAELSDVEAKLRTVTGEEIYRQQGHAQRLDKLLADLTGKSMKLVRSQPPPGRESRQVSNS